MTIPGPILLRDGLEHGYRLDLGLQPYWRGRLLSLELEATDGKVDFTHASVTVGDIPNDDYEANLETPGAASPKDPLVLSSYEAQSKHFRIIWSGDRNKEGFTRKNALGTLRNAEQIWQFYVKVMHMREPCYSMDSDARSGRKFKTNILNLYMGYYMSGSDAGFGYTNIESSGLRVDPPGWVLPHELMHVFEMHQGGQMPGNWWEAYADYGCERWITYYAPFLFPDRSLPGGQVSSLETGYAMMSNWILPHGRDYYLCWPIFSYLDENPDHLPGLGGGDFTPKLWQQAKDGETIFDTVQRLTKSATSTKSILGLYTRRNVTWDYANQPAMRKNVDVDSPDLRRFALTDLEQRGDDPTWWRVPLDRAPQQGGYTVHELKLAPGNKDRTFTLTFHGLHDTVRGADWRPSLVVVNDHGGQRYGSMWNEHSNFFKLAPDENRLYLVVAATPDTYLPGEFDDEEFPFQSHPQRQRFPYEVQLQGAVPVEFDNGDHAGLIEHPNGGGWKSPSATVADTAYIGPDARVLGSAKVLGEARVEDYAVVQGAATVLDHAIISGHGVVSDEAIVKDFAKVRDWGGISGSAVASFQARILEHGQVAGSAVVSDYATVEGYATVWKDTPDDRVGGDAVISGDYGGGCSVRNGFQFGFIPYKGTLQQWIDDRTAPAHLYVDYEFDKANQSLAKDFYGIGDGVLEGAPDWSGGDFERSGILLFNGQDQYVSLPRQAVDFHEGTFMCWVRPGRGSAISPFSPSAMPRIIFMRRSITEKALPNWSCTPGIKMCGWSRTVPCH